MSVIAANAQTPKKHVREGDPVIGHRIAKGVVASGRLWLRGVELSRKGGAGGLISLNVTDDSRAVHFERGVLDMEKSGANFRILRQISADRRDYVVSEWENGAFADLAALATPDNDEPIILLEIAGNIAVLSQSALHVLSADRAKWSAVRLGSELRFGVQASVAPPRSGYTPLLVPLEASQAAGAVPQ